MPMSATLNPPTEVDIDRASAVPAPDDDTLIAWAAAALDALGLHGVSVAVRLVDADEAQALNRDYRGKDYATNVLTFDYQREPLVMADLVLCAPVVAREAREQGKRLAAHWAHMVVHGTLHLLGYDHARAADARRMEGRERALLARLGIADPYGS